MNYLLLHQISNELLLFLTFNIRGEYPHKLSLAAGLHNSEMLVRAMLKAGLTVRDLQSPEVCFFRVIDEQVLWPDIEPASFSKGTINFHFHLKKRKSPLKTVTPSQGSLPDRIFGGGIIRSI